MSLPAELATLHIDAFYLILNHVLSDTIECCTLHPVKLDLIFREFPKKFRFNLNHIIREFDDFPPEPDIRESLKQHEKLIQHWISTLTWDSVIFSKINSITGISDSTGNNDIRGGGCGRMKFTEDDFKYTIKTSGDVTLRHLTELIYRLKGSKYDYWYELFNCISVLQHDTNEMSLTIDVSFGYGS